MKIADIEKHKIHFSKEAINTNDFDIKHIIVSNKHSFDDKSLSNSLVKKSR